MKKYRIYLDNCCYNRPYDEQNNFIIFLETQAKMYIQEQILSGKFYLVWSYILEYENDNNPFYFPGHEIGKWRYCSSSVIEESPDIVKRANELIKKGIKLYDALHIASAIIGQADYFITVDKKL